MKFTFTAVRFILQLALIICCTASLFAQTTALDTKEKAEGLTYEVELGYFVGGSGSISFFAYNSAINLNFAVGKRIQDNVLITGSIGVERNLEGTLYPLAANLKRYFGANSNQFVMLQAGYSWGNGESDSSSFFYRGGLVTGLAYGINLFTVKESNFYAQIGYKLRRSELTFQPFDGSNIVSSNFENHFAALNVGIQF